MWLCGVRVVAPDPEAALKRANGASAIVAFTELSELADDYPAYAAWLGSHDGGMALWFPIADFQAPELSEAIAMVDAIVACLHAGKGLILHCAGGLGRAPTIALCALIALGMSADQAAAHILAHRRMAGPEVEAQRLLVEAFARYAGFG